jgi:monovalent cation:H+ antiporter-2, CPA2 family
VTAVSSSGELVVAVGEVPGYLGPTAALVVAAAVIGYLTARAHVVPIVGFLIAGVLRRLGTLSRGQLCVLARGFHAG